MSQLYVYENGAIIGITDGRIEIKSDGLSRSIPFERVDGLSVFGSS
ncbi:MAG: CRISPR-associated endonuclease Cas1 [Clostridiales bacterium]|jgi:CRISPR/Cas system-associated endonuclease Cas1|nr:CRISPR-associated endonuclease Cas1 [Clostridiales bacterium]